MARKDKVIKLHIDFIEYDIDVIFTSNTEKYRNEVLTKRHSYMPRYDKEFYALHTWVGEIRKSWCIFPHGVEIDVIVHEFTHVADAIIEYFSFEGTEIRAHIIGYLTKNMRKRKLLSPSA